MEELDDDTLSYIFGKVSDDTLWSLASTCHRFRSLILLADIFCTRRLDHYTYTSFARLPIPRPLPSVVSRMRLVKSCVWDLSWTMCRSDICQLQDDIIIQQMQYMQSASFISRCPLEHTLDKLLAAGILRTIGLENCKGMTDVMYMAVARYERLETLTINANRDTMSLDVMRAIGNSTSLRSLNVKNSILRTKTRPVHMENMLFPPNIESVTLTLTDPYLCNRIGGLLLPTDIATPWSKTLKRFELKIDSARTEENLSSTLTPSSLYALIAIPTIETIKLCTTSTGYPAVSSILGNKPCIFGPNLHTVTINGAVRVPEQFVEQLMAHSAIESIRLSGQLQLAEITPTTVSTSLAIFAISDAPYLYSVVFPVDDPNIEYKLKTLYLSDVIRLRVVDNIPKSITHLNLSSSATTVRFNTITTQLTFRALARCPQLEYIYAEFEFISPEMLNMGILSTKTVCMSWYAFMNDITKIDALLSDPLCKVHTVCIEGYREPEPRRSYKPWCETLHARYGTKFIYLKHGCSPFDESMSHY